MEYMEYTEYWCIWCMMLSGHISNKGESSPAEGLHLLVEFELAADVAKERHEFGIGEWPLVDS